MEDERGKFVMKSDRAKATQDLRKAEETLDMTSEEFAQWYEKTRGVKLPKAKELKQLYRFYLKAMADRGSMPTQRALREYGLTAEDLTEQGEDVSFDFGENSGGGYSGEVVFQAAMYRSKINNLKEFRNYAKKHKSNKEKNNSQFYSVNDEYDIVIPQERIISGKNKKLSDEDLIIIEESLKKPVIESYEILNGTGAYKGISVNANVKTVKGKFKILFDFTENGRIFFEEAEFIEPDKKLARMRTSELDAVSPGLIYSIDDIIEDVNIQFEKTIEQRPVNELKNTVNKLKDKISARENRIYNKDNFYRKTISDFKTVETPDRKPDYVSASGSKYWYTDKGVFRQSDHWGKVSTNQWNLDGKDNIQDVKTGFAKYSDFIYNSAKDKARLKKYQNALKIKEREEKKKHKSSSSSAGRRRKMQIHLRWVKPKKWSKAAQTAKLSAGRRAGLRALTVSGVLK